jgi:hypothetical protein
MRRWEALALLLGPSLVASAVSVAVRLDDDDMSAADVRAFCSSYRVLTSADVDEGSRVLAARQLLASASDNLKDDVRFVYHWHLQSGPHNGSHEDYARAQANIERTAARRC